MPTDHDPVPSKKVWVGTSWKMTKTLAESRAYAARLSSAAVPERVQPFVLPPLTALATVRQALAPSSPVLLGAQTAHWAPEGAWTGEVSMGMVADAGANLVEIGHSERRAHAAETDEVVARKVRACLDAGLTPLLCLGEPAAIRRRGSGPAADFVLRQLASGLGLVRDVELGDVLIAYEPIWSIGEGGVAATPADVEPVLAAVHETATALGSGTMPLALLYGGSVTLSNAADLLAIPLVDGVFVGRAAWHVEGLLALVDLAGRVA